MSLAAIVAPALLMGFCLVLALIAKILLDKEKGEIPVIVILTFVVFAFYFAQIVASGAYEAEKECSMYLNQTHGISNVTHVTETYTYNEYCTSAIPDSAPLSFKMVMLLWRVLPWAWLIFLIYWVFRGLADKEKLTRI